jgi:hypothetical protein
MSEEKTPDTHVPTKIDEQHLEADLTEEELTSVVGGATKEGSLWLNATSRR